MTVGPIDFLPDTLYGSNTSSSSNVTIPGWYGIQSDPACSYGQVLNTRVSGHNVVVTFADQDGGCIYEPTPFPINESFTYTGTAFDCERNDTTVARGGLLIFGRLTPPKLAHNDKTAAAVIYCQPRVDVVSVDITFKLMAKTLLSVDNVQPLSPKQQQSYDPNDFITNFLASGARNGFSIDPALSMNIDSPLIDRLNQWINKTISVVVGAQWLDQSTMAGDEGIIDIPQPCTSPSLHMPNAYLSHSCILLPDSDQMREYYISSLTNFYQTYLTLVRLTFGLSVCYCSINEPPYSWRQDTSWMDQ